MARQSSSSPFDPSREPALRWRRDAPASTHYFIDRWRSTSSAAKWGAMVLTAVLSGVFAILGALYQNSVTGAPVLLLVVVLGPAIEETLKISGIVYVAEQRPWLVPRAFVVPIIALISGLVFAVVENFWYLSVLISNPPMSLVRWRWMFGPLVHGVGSFTAGLGVAAMWTRSFQTGQRPSMNIVQPWLLAAIAWHGCYNLFAIFVELR